VPGRVGDEAPATVTRTVGTFGSTQRGRAAARSLGGILVAVAIWELVSVSGLVTKQALAGVWPTASALFTHAGALTSAAAATLKAWAVGLSIASVLGIACGSLVGRSRLLEAFTEILVRMMRPLPSLALIPVAILVAGLGLKMTAGLVAFTSFWPIFINTRYGVQQVDTLLIDTARTLGMRRATTLLRVIIPAAAQLIASGLQVAISLALVVTVSVELVSGSGGLGTFVLQAQQGGAVATMYAGITVGGFVGWVLNRGWALVVARTLPWTNRLERS
jgi:ABC-type nitrate/sulfonate/bicarbonate transport system permease component